MAIGMRHGRTNGAHGSITSAASSSFCCSVGITLVAPGLLFFFLIVASPFVIYALVGGPRKQAAAAPIRPRTRVEGVLGWIGAAIVVGATAFMAFVAAFVAVCTGGLALGVVTQYQNENLCTFIGIASLVAGFFAAVMAATSVTRRYRS